MRKIPTLFRRNPDRPALITREVHPDCWWVLDGDGVATRKHDGTCVGFFPVVHGKVRTHGVIGSDEVSESGDITGAVEGLTLTAQRTQSGEALTALGWTPPADDPHAEQTSGREA